MGGQTEQARDERRDRRRAVANRQNAGDRRPVDGAHDRVN
jgi:hypothetical protein